MFSKFCLLLALNIVISPLLISSVNSQSSIVDRRLAQRPAPPKRIPPNKVKPGGGLDSSISACSQQQKSLIALVPVENPVLSTKSHPSFLFYIPDTASTVSHGEFSLFTADDKTRIYSTTVSLSQTPGIIKIDLPNSPEYALETNLPYHWYFKIYCEKPSPEAYVDVDGWIKRVDSTSVTEQQIQAASPKVWYDSIARVADNLIAAPQDPKARDRLLKLLQYIEQEDLVDVDIRSIAPSNPSQP
jgi:hypothetical protein